MKKFILLVYFVVVYANLFSQQAKIYSLPQNESFAAFKSVRLSSAQDKLIFVRKKINTQFTEQNYYKLNKQSNSLMPVYGTFLNSDFVFCDSLDAAPVDDFVISFLNPNILMKSMIISCDSVNNEGLYITYNSGASSDYMQVNDCLGFDINPKRSSVIVAGSHSISGGYHIIVSRDTGNTWSAPVDVAPCRPLSRGGFIKYNPSDTSIIFAGGENNLLRSSNSGISFQAISCPAFKNIYFAGDQMIYGTTKNKIYNSTDKGLTWQILSQPDNFDFNCLEISPDNPAVLYAGSNIGIFKSTDYGYNWSLYNNVLSPSKKIIGISKDPGSGDTLFACTTDGIYKVWGYNFVLNSFISPLKIGNYFQYAFTTHPEPPTYYSTKIISDTVFQNGIRYFKIQTGSLFSYEYFDTLSLRWFKYDPSCSNSNQSGNSLIIDFNENLHERYNICNGSREIVYKGVSTNFLNSNQPLSFIAAYPTPIIDANDYQYMEKFGFTASEGFSYSINMVGAIIDGVTYGQIIGVEPISNIIPAKFDLQQNYPNPFNPVTQIKFDIPKLSKVKLTIYDALGREVAKLVDSELKPGTYNADFNGAALSSGVYFYRLETSDFVSVKKMALIK